MNNITEIKNSLCIGCGLCYKVCPKSAIEIVRNKQGFYSAKVNEKCIQCGKCKKVCYKFLDDKSGMDIESSERFLAYSKNEEIRYRASSGGVGEELYNYAIDNEYEICGVTYDYDENVAKHIIFNDKRNINSIVGSKYIPSYTVDAIKRLDKNKKYLIIGTPCQIYGLRKYMEHNMIEEWILVDFFCHGSASLNLWDKYLDMIRREYKLEKINYVNFRDKSEGWHRFSIVIDDGVCKYKCNLEKDIFMGCFLRNVDLQESCYDCKLRYNKIYSDIRLGDFWGEKCKHDEKGTSIILINTSRGNSVWGNLKDVYKEEISLDELRASQKICYLKVPRLKNEFQNRLLGNEKLENIFNDVINKIKKTEKIKNTLKIPLKIARKIKKIVGTE